MDEEEQDQTEDQAPSPIPPPPQAPAVIKTSGLAIASLVLAILGVFTCVTAPIALALGIIALVQIGRNPQALRGTGMAIAGVVIGGIAVLLAPVILGATAAILFPVLGRAKHEAKQDACLNNVKRLSTAMLMYCADWEERYPFADNWNEALEPYVRNPRVFVCPSEDSAEPSYAMNVELSGQSEAVADPPFETVVLFESVPGKNQAGGEELLPAPPRHMGWHTVGFADGHVTTVEESEVGSLAWRPVTETYWP